MAKLSIQEFGAISATLRAVVADVTAPLAVRREARLGLEIINRNHTQADVDADKATAASAVALPADRIQAIRDLVRVATRRM